MNEKKITEKKRKEKKEKAISSYSYTKLNNRGYKGICYSLG